ncbi:MAG: ABC transporter substrate-binding protein [Chromatiales bacterium]|nr:ABC transporter substrate-binding protein [Chromatiales bacterium]
MLRNKFWSMASHSLATKIVVLPAIWLLLISLAHYYLNFETTDRKIIRMGYMPVITNMAAPLLDRATMSGEGVRYKAIKYSSFSEMAESIRNNQIDAAFMIAPLSIVLRQQGADVKLVYIGNRHESTLVTRKDLNITEFPQLAGKTIAVPIRFSGHNLSALALAKKYKLEGEINIVEMNPPDMASALAAGSLDAYYVGEPFAAKTLKSGHASLLNYVEDVWPGFICNLVIVNNSLIESDPELVQQFVSAAARSGMWARANSDEAATIASSYWNQDVDLVNYALNTPQNRIIFDKFIPRSDEMQDIADRMVENGLISNDSIEGLIDDRFARSANLDGVTTLESILRSPTR